MQQVNEVRTRKTRPSATLNQAQEEAEMMSEGGGSQPSDFLRNTGEPVNSVELDAIPMSESQFRVRPDVESTAQPPKKAATRWIEQRAKKFGQRWLSRLVTRKGKVTRSMRSIPTKLHRTARQSELVLELIDDFRLGTYRNIPWRSVALLAGTLLYTVSPADIIPDVLPFIGAIDDVSIIALVTRLVQSDLAAYCSFKGYDMNDYFGAA